MNYNTTYKPQISLKDTIKESEKIKNIIIDFFKKRASLVETELPSFYEEGDQLVSILPIVSRNVTSDLSHDYKTIVLPLTNSNWIRDLIDRINLNENEGVFAYENTIWRDIKELPVQTTSNHELVFQIKIDNNELEDYLNILTQDLYYLILNKAKQLSKKYDFKQIYPNEIQFSKAQYLETEMPNNTPKEREEYHIIEKEAFVLSRSGEKLYSGKFHWMFPTDLYDFKKTNQIMLKDRVNTSALDVALIAIMANGIQLNDQLELYDSSHLLSSNFHKNLTKQKYKIIEARINMPKLMMALLAKGHISEVQPGVISEESEIIRTRYKVSKY